MSGAKSPSASTNDAQMITIIFSVLFTSQQNIVLETNPQQPTENTQQTKPSPLYK